MSSSKAWDNSALALWMASRYLGSMATSPGNGGEGRDWFWLKRRCHDSGRKKSTYQRSLITPDHGFQSVSAKPCGFMPLRGAYAHPRTWEWAQPSVGVYPKKRPQPVGTNEI